MSSKEFEELLNLLRKGEIVLWAGSGLSLYAGYPTSDGIVEAIMSKVPGEQRIHFKDQSLKEVAGEYEKLFGREKLNKILIELFQIEPKSLGYHKKFSLIPQLKTIITTNYDTLFERIYKESLKVIVTNEDLVTSNHNKIQLLKIHGTIESPETIKITSSDYQTFFNEEQSRNPIWTEIKSICTRNSVIFVGYSLQDTDVKYILYQILNQLNGCHKDIFLIAPKIPEHTIRDLSEKYHVIYLDKTGEEFISELINEINRNLIEDFRLGRISIEDYQHSLKLRGIQSTIIKESDGKVKLDARVESGTGQPTEIKYHIEDEDLRERFQDFIAGKSGTTSFEISSEGSKGKATFSIEEKGIQFPPQIYDRYHITITLHPLSEYNTTIRIKGKDIVISNLPTKVYRVNELLIFEIFHPRLKITLKINQKIQEKSEFRISYQWDGSPNQSYEIIKMLYLWVTGSDMIVINQETGYQLNIPIANVNLPPIEIDRIKAIFKIISDLMKIQDYFGITFRNIVEITEEDFQKIDLLLMIAKDEIAFSDNISANVESYDTVLLSKMLLEETSEMEIDGTQDIELFDKIIPIKSKVIINDAYIENSESILQQIQTGIQNIKIVIKSRSGKIPVILNKSNM